MKDFLKKNAEYFEKKAKEAFEEKAYKFVLFFAEQALQLYLKYILFRLIEDCPKTHKPKILFEELGKINLLEEAYITSRYLDKEYSEKSAKRL